MKTLSSAPAEQQGAATTHWFRGRLMVRTLAGRHGEFNVADLTTPVGSFRIKDKFLDEFEAGVYSGEFEISHIGLGCYTLKSGATISEIRAAVVNYNIDEEEAEAEAPSPAVIDEPDPVDETPPPAAPAADEKPAEKPERENIAETQKELFHLFNEDLELVNAVLAGEQVKLDPSIAAADEAGGRLRFRKQRDYLKTNGWRFNAKTQCWTKGGGQ